MFLNCLLLSDKFFKRRHSVECRRHSLPSSSFSRGGGGRGSCRAWLEARHQAVFCGGRGRAPLSLWGLRVRRPVLLNFAFFTLLPLQQWCKLSSSSTQVFEKLVVFSQEGLYEPAPGSARVGRSTSGRRSWGSRFGRSGIHLPWPRSLGCRGRPRDLFKLDRPALLVLLQ